MFNILVIAVVTILLVLYIHSKRKRKREILLKIEGSILAANNDFNLLTNFQYYLNFRRAKKWKKHYEFLIKEIISDYKTIGLDSNFVQQIELFQENYHQFEGKRNKYNHEFVVNEQKQFAHLFNTLEAFPLDEQQQKAILNDEDNTLIIAGAGTGKTSTIVGKVAYLLEKGIAQPEELLLISFTKKAASEMKDRLSELLGTPINVKTFNALGYDIIGSVEGAKPDLAFDGNEQVLEHFFNNQIDLLFQDEHFSDSILNFFLYEMIPEKEENSFKSLNEYYLYVKAYNLLTLKGERVKSLEELKIANFLYINGIDYEYERIFQPEQRDPRYKKYRPDFFLTDYNITLEHFGINRDGSVPPFFTGRDGKSATETYQAGIEWKQSIHETHNIQLLESYSYENSEGVLLENLTEKLISAEVIFRPIPRERILDKLQRWGKVSDFIKLIHTFLNLVKSNQVSIDDLKKKMIGQENSRVDNFLKIFERLYTSYEEKLRQEQWVDFNDMLIKAGTYINQKNYLSPYSYIMVDEFQDMSIGRFKFLKSLLDQNPNQKLFCVGDDWQSIYRFTGSDISITTQFEEYFGYTYKGRIETTYRFNDKILDFTSSFIQKNPTQSRKQLKSKSIYQHGIPFEIFELEEIDRNNQTYRYATVRNILTYIKYHGHKEEGTIQKVLFIGRYNFNKPKYLLQVQQEFPDLHISFLTAHKAKGVTVDYTILLDVVSGKYGFPTEMADDELLSLVLHEGDDFDNSEERRLFYVALTRAKQMNFLITHKSNRSKFIEEMKNDLFDAAENTEKICKNCKGTVVKRSGKFGEFWGCSNYPICDFTENIKMEDLVMELS